VISPKNTSALADLPNLGPKSAHMLAQAGITSVAQLRCMGALGAYVQVLDVGGAANLNLLWALEGAYEKTLGRSQVFSSPSGGLARSDRSGGALTTGLTWQEVARVHRTSLLLALDQITSGRHL
jgi:DNA transformation protein and related proteins